METGPPHAKHQEMTSCLMKEVQTHAVVSGSGNHHPINEGVEEGRFGADRERLWLQRPQKQAAGTTHRSGGWWRSFGGWEKLDGWNEAQAQWSPVAEGAEGQGVSSAPIPPSRKLLPGLSSPVGFRDPRSRFCPNVAKVLCVRMWFVPRSGLSPRLTASMFR